MIRCLSSCLKPNTTNGNKKVKMKWWSDFLVLRVKIGICSVPFGVT